MTKKAKAEEKDVKNALKLLTTSKPRAKAAWLIAAKRGKTAKAA